MEVKERRDSPSLIKGLSALFVLLMLGFSLSELADELRESWKGFPFYASREFLGDTLWDYSRPIFWPW